MRASFIHRTLNFRYLKQTRKVPIQTLVNRIFVTQHRSKARVTFAFLSCHAWAACAATDKILFL